MSIQQPDMRQRSDDLFRAEVLALGTKAPSRGASVGGG